MRIEDLQPAHEHQRQRHDVDPVHDAHRQARGAGRARAASRPRSPIGGAGRRGVIVHRRRPRCWSARVAWRPACTAAVQRSRQPLKLTPARLVVPRERLQARRRAAARAALTDQQRHPRDRGERRAGDRTSPPGPIACHSHPASALATSSATPLARLKTPNAVPRRSAGAVAATSAASSPCVSAMCSPHSAAPASTPAALRGERQHDVARDERARARGQQRGRVAAVGARARPGTRSAA